ncbi:hypothetical protein [Streptomyces sp. NPDC046197]|uniref:hypothetical protein n=1 Tax=Streptomyces sp. NPDC046197 TaxID=3154337 RepID=UPI0033CFEF99
MHRTTTTATLLVTVAVSALSGCVTVQRPPAPGPRAAPTWPSGPRPDGSTEPRAVQAPAREALEMVGPPHDRSTTAHTRAPAAPAAPPAERHRPPPSHTHHPTLPEPRHRHHDRLPRVETPGVPQPVPKVPNTTDVCALGRQYGGWKTDSPEATICRQAYGR